jgi:hypothetical protein
MYYSYKVFGSARGNLTPPIMWRDVRSSAPACPLASGVRWNAEQPDLQNKLTVWLLTEVAQSVQWLVTDWLPGIDSPARTDYFDHRVQTDYQTDLSRIHWVPGNLSQVTKRSRNAPILVEVILMLLQAPRKGIWRSGGLTPWIRNIATRLVVS